MTAGEPLTLMHAWAGADPDAPWFADTADRRVLTRRAFGELVERAAARLAGLGPVLVFPATRTPGVLVGVLAAWRLGAAAGIAPPGIPLATLAAEWGGVPVAPEPLLAPGPVRDVPAFLPEPDDLALLLPTSGSSGRPKGVRLSHRALLASISTLHNALGLGPRDRWLASLPLHTFAGARAAWLGPLQAGGVVLDASEVPAFAVRKGVLLGATMLSGAPAWLRGLGRVPRGVERPILVIGAPIGDRLALQAELAHPIVDGYGLTETAGVFVLARGHDAGVGRLIRGRMRLVDADGNDGAVGEVWFGGDSRMDGYVGGPPAPEWIATGDLGRLDAEGCLHLLGRRDRRWSLPSGEVVVPEELEGALGCECVAVPAGDVVGVLAARPVDPARVRALGPGVRVVEVDTLPRLPSGKVDVREAMRRFRG